MHGWSTEWYVTFNDYVTQFPGVIQAEMNQRGGLPFLHVGFETHQYAVRAKHTINVGLRDDMRLYGGEDKSVRATWACAPPASAPHHMRGTSWTTRQLHSFDGHEDHQPHIPPPTHPETWANWYWTNSKKHSTVAWRYDSSACPEHIHAEWVRQLQGNPNPGQEEPATTEDAWSTAS